MRSETFTRLSAALVLFLVLAAAGAPAFGQELKFDEKTAPRNPRPPRPRSSRSWSAGSS